jgi:hypothetical protein
MFIYKTVYFFQCNTESLALSQNGINKLKVIEGKNLPKLTVFAKKETGSQIGINSSSEAGPLSIQKTDLLQMPLFDPEKPGPNNSAQTPNKASAQKKFNEYLVQAVDEALTSLGEPVKNTIYFQLENNFSIPKNKIPDQIDEFTNIMHKIFGLGASRLEIKFMKNLHSKIKVSIETNGCEWPLSKWIIEDLSFVDYVNKMRENYCSCNEKNELLQKTDALVIK